MEEKETQKSQTHCKPAEYRVPKCLGIKGYLFGHKFHTLMRENYSNCQRCGMKMGTLVKVNS